MKRIALLALAIVPAASAFAVNILDNPGFETGGIASWYNARDFGGIAPWVAVNNDAHSGSWSAYGVGNWEIRQDFAAVAVSDITELSFWLKHPTMASAPTAFDLFYSDGSDDEFITGTSTTEWEFKDVTSFLSTGKFLTGFSVWGYVGGGDQDTYIDDATLNVVPEPASIIALASGLAVMARRRRKA